MAPKSLSNKNKERKPKTKVPETKKVEPWTLLYANVRGISSKIACVKEVLAETKPDVALFTETHLPDDKGVKVEGYTFFGQSRKNQKGGGVGFLVREDRKSVVAPHITNREIEMSWVSIHRQCATPLYIGVYYGKQETTCNKQLIQKEMDLLSEELLEISQEGEVIVCMDANAKIGLMGENMSRNGKLMQTVFDECGMEVINSCEKCEGTITRQNRKNEEEKSAIDLVVATYEASQWIKKMKIDEEGVHRMKNKAESDHNTIFVNMEIPKFVTPALTKVTTWNLKASSERFAEFRNKIGRSVHDAGIIMSDKSTDISKRYKKWEHCLYKAAISTIGKTTRKRNELPPPSNEIKRLRNERRKMKQDFETETKSEEKRLKLDSYMRKQGEIKEKMLEEEAERIERKFEKMKEDGNNGFWRERKEMNRDDSHTWLTTKGKDGKRIFDPEQNKENIAQFYEDLYKKPQITPHPYHLEVQQGIKKLSEDNGVTQDDSTPTEAEIKKVIANKKNKKATTDWKNEIIKQGGDEMVDFIYPVIKAFWEEESPPKQWNDGLITNVWKGKGDRESMDNQRGITVSSAIGTIAEEIVFNRITNLMDFTQAQAGGRKGSSPADHIFIIRNIISIAKADKRNIIITFYDVRKAYDKADMNDMLYSLNKSNVSGRLWRLTKSLNQGLTARVNTKAGITREIKRETGGKQGGKVIVPLFAKMMDNWADDCMESQTGVVIGETSIPGLLYMDDLASMAEGYSQQEQTLHQVNEFSIKHKLEWGQAKCKVMELGYHKEKRSSWKLGDKEISSCQSYKYLGEKISRDGKNDENLKERSNKVRATVRSIMTCCKSDIIKRMATKVMIQLHESQTVSSLLYNSETWTLNSKERNFLDQIELYAWKKMIGLPQTTPTAGIIYTTGSFFASIRVEIRQLTYLQKVLQRKDGHWTRVTLNILEEKNVGWAKQINQTLDRWGLETEWKLIAKKSSGQWRKEVKDAAK